MGINLSNFKRCIRDNPGFNVEISKKIFAILYKNLNNYKKRQSEEKSLTPERGSHDSNRSPKKKKVRSTVRSQESKSRSRLSYPNGHTQQHL